MSKKQLVKIKHRDYVKIKGYKYVESTDSYLSSFIKSIINIRRFRNAVRLAESRHKESNNKFFYIVEYRPKVTMQVKNKFGSRIEQVDSNESILLVFHNKELNALVKAGYFTKRMGSHLEIEKIALYYTFWGDKQRKDAVKNEKNRIITKI
jgi:hypothetical protein